ncbi:MAG: type II toxin-antitoxin system PemK/MazF family toxin, partial [Desulfobacterales bacterium]
TNGSSSIKKAKRVHLIRGSGTTDEKEAQFPVGADLVCFPCRKNYPTRISCTFQDKKGQIVLDQIRTIDKARFIKKLGSIDPQTQVEVISTLQRLFAF